LIEFDPYQQGYWYTGPADNTIQVLIEDWAGSNGVPGDALFDSVKIEIKKK
jgi:hypothetical protein